MVFETTALLVNLQPALDFAQVGELNDSRVRFFGGITLSSDEREQPNKVFVFIDF
jgi:hypothetical protein